MSTRFAYFTASARSTSSGNARIPRLGTYDKYTCLGCARQRKNSAPARYTWTSAACTTGAFPLSLNALCFAEVRSPTHTLVDSGAKGGCTACYVVDAERVHVCDAEPRRLARGAPQVSADAGCEWRCEFERTARWWERRRVVFPRAWPQVYQAPSARELRRRHE
ncbi:hypothetical protein B0H19DRAFT_1068272 [Mycena capillaripes]|nr:hypothetical protein B0H19DRAFT_1068272 [Mycena capillaripes]